MAHDDDELDGCDLDFAEGPQLTEQDDVDAVVMFADVFDDPEKVAQRARELRELTGEEAPDVG